VQRIRLLAQETGGSVRFGHRAAQFASLRKSAEGWYEQARRTTLATPPPGC
jgi:hypothetical protein